MLNCQSYFLDPTQARIYKLSSDPNLLTDNKDDKIKICYGEITLIEKFKDIKSIESKVLLPSTSLDEDQTTIESTKKLCESNQDVFDEFYKENSDSYEELSEKLMLLEKPKSLIKRRRR